MLTVSSCDSVSPRGGIQVSRLGSVCQLEVYLGLAHSSHEYCISAVWVTFFAISLVRWAAASSQGSHVAYGHSALSFSYRMYIDGTFPFWTLSYRSVSPFSWSKCSTSKGYRFIFMCQGSVQYRLILFVIFEQWWICYLFYQSMHLQPFLHVVFACRCLKTSQSSER